MKKQHALKIATIVPLILILSILILFSGSSADGQTTPKVTIIDDGGGNITVDVSDPSNPTYGIKCAWQYGDYWANKGQAGGNLYQLYNRSTDPTFSRNLISMTDWGVGTSKAIQLGVGGTGVTAIYAVDAAGKPGVYQGLGFADFISDNNLSAVPVGSPASYVEGDPVSPDYGHAIVTFSYRMHNLNTGQEWYKADKVWNISPDGTICFSLTWTILRDGYFSEPGMRVRWDNAPQWDRWLKFGSDWTNPAYKYLLSTTNLANKYLAPGAGAGMDGRVVYESWDVLNTFNPDWLALTGSPTDPAIKITGTPGYSFGPSGFSPTMEQSVGQQIVRFYDGHNETIGEHASAWMAWWGGNPPPGSRYVHLSSGTSWTDSFKFELIQNNADVLQKTPAERYGPEITNVKVYKSAQSASVVWGTDISSNSVVELRMHGVWVEKGRNNNLTTNHSVSMSGLESGFPYAYRVRSIDAQGNEATSFDTNFTKSITDGPGGGDCETMGTWDPATKTCTLNQDIVILADNGIEVLSDNITIDGNGHKLFGNGNSGTGVYIYGRSGVSIKDLFIENMQRGIWLVFSDGNTLENNHCNSDNEAIMITASDNNIITGNTATSRINAGIRIYDGSLSNTLTGNTVNFSKWGMILNDSGSNMLSGNQVIGASSGGFHISGNYDKWFDNSIDTSNLIDGKSIYYIRNAFNQVYDSSTNAGIFYCINCSNVTIRGLNLSGNEEGLYLRNTQGSLIENVNATGNVSGIYLFNSSNNVLQDNIANYNTGNGFTLYSQSGSAGETSRNNEFRRNKANSNVKNGIELATASSSSTSSDNNILSDNTFNSNNSAGIKLKNAYWNTFSGNHALSNGTGVASEYSSHNSYLNNVCSNNNTGISLGADGYDILDGNVTDHGQYGIIISTSNILTLRNNSMFSNSVENFSFNAASSESDGKFNHDIDTSNTVDGKPIYYIMNADNQIYDSSSNAGVFFCINCNNVVIRDLRLSHNNAGIYLRKTKNSIIENNRVTDTMWGIFLSQSSNNMVIGNEANSNRILGMVLELNSNENKIVNNTLFFNRAIGMQLLSNSNNNIVYNNNFSDRVYIQNSASNIFNVGVPLGGNYWKNHDEPAEGCTNLNGDGFCDTPYGFYGTQDSLPWTTQNGWQQGKPSLTLNRPTTHWASYANYLMRKLSVTWTLTNNGSIDALDVIINSGIDTNRVSINVLASPLPITVSSRISAYGGSTSFTLVYDIPDGVGSWQSKLSGQAKDITGSVYSY